MSKIIIYTDQKTSRLNYVSTFISQSFQTIELDSICVSDHLDTTRNTIGINYSSLPLNNCLKMPIANCLEDGRDISSFEDFGRELNYSDDSFNFDMFSAIFYLLSRAEEYHSTDLDEHGRFKSSNSILAIKKILGEPVVDYWLLSFLEIINSYYNIDLKAGYKYSFNSTLDIDHFFAYKHKSLTIALGSFIRDLIKLKLKSVTERFRSIDPFDTFNDIFEFHKSIGLELKLFILCSRRSKFDKSLPPENREFIYRVQRYADKYPVGIHPSYKSGRNEEQLGVEIKLLESMISRNVTDSRQHYILLNIPETYRALIKAGIENDYSMGYPETIGFRAGTSLPFNWYDLENEECTSLVVHPFQLMDVSLKNYMGLDPEEAIEEARKIIDNVKKVNGECTIIWHNSSFSELHGWEGWKQVYFDILTAGKP
ncbi:MAG: polysaccharide deacetylase family protein [Bacteroidia bacterium]|nr:polysaccharide deacetylase family protein [Bacteroidia bacterium]